MSNALPDLATLFDAVAANPRAKKYVDHNIRNWASLQGALACVREHPMSFNQMDEYWALSERRVLVAYLAKRLKFNFASHAATRAFALAVARHFERARQEGRFGEPGYAIKHPLGWSELLRRIEQVAGEIQLQAEFDAVRIGTRRRWADTLREDLLEFLASSEVRESEVPNDFEPNFSTRIRWFPYCGGRDLAEVVERQFYFVGFYGVFASTNSYSVGGGMSFAPILQNNPTDRLIEFVKRWEAGESPHQTGFTVEGKNGPLEAWNYSVVTELFGFLNLHRQPFHNGAARYHAAFAEPDDVSATQLTERVGRETLAFLKRNPEEAERFARFLTEKVENQPSYLPLSMERRADEPGWEADCAGTDDVSLRIAAEMRAAVSRKVEALGPLDRAAIALHLHLDAIMLPWLNRPEVSSSPVASEEPAMVQDAPSAPYGTAPVQPSGRTIALPPSLQPVGNDALAYLRAGFHVLFAGAPGTGKTTVAQFVGHAWNRGLDRVDSRIDMAFAPVTTVASSAWAPFHTIGGILPGDDGRFRVQRGIFIDPTEHAPGEWRMRSECIVLDEMNRADLDRCIGELYPLLSHSVREVVPAGVPGVRRILEDDRFRIVATVNDATIDDIVFPISEGLARRFIRIELAGALESEVRQFLEGWAEGADGSRVQAAIKSVANLYSACREKGKLRESEAGERLDFGVGYFRLLAAWVGGQLSMSQEFNELEPYDQAVEMLRTSLRSATRDRGYDPVFRQVADAVV